MFERRARLSQQAGSERNSIAATIWPPQSTACVIAAHPLQPSVQLCDRSWTAELHGTPHVAVTSTPIASPLGAQCLAEVSSHPWQGRPREQTVRETLSEKQTCGYSDCAHRRRKHSFCVRQLHAMQQMHSSPAMKTPSCPNSSHVHEDSCSSLWQRQLLLLPPRLEKRRILATPLETLPASPTPPSPHVSINKTLGALAIQELWL
mmetsp:Transcript_15389/g.27443  ORF Transcript_15389/g.27443 Transcript_15389/m.27443 type:complete len:205 (-) Transcript_15389:156-770(-)